MEDGPQSQTPCVVVLSRDRRAGEVCCAQWVRIVRVPSAFEAAAQLLACPCAALVVELSMLGGKHKRLLEIARQMGVEILGLGALPGWADCDSLSGVRLTSWGQLPSAIEGLCAGEGPAETRYETTREEVASGEAAQSNSPAARDPSADQADSGQGKAGGDDEDLTDSPPPLPQGVYESDTSLDLMDLELGVADIGGTYEQDLAPAGSGQRPAAPPAVGPVRPLHIEEEQEVSAGDIGKWISGLDEDHVATAPAVNAAPPDAGQRDHQPQAQPPPAPRPAPPQGRPLMGPIELNGLLTPEELEALLSKDK